jgi:5'-3' exonuclease
MNALHRAAHSYQDLSVVSEDGSIILTGATFGFLQIVKGIWEKYARGPESQLVVCWDGGYRHRLALYPEYKANRRNRDLSTLEPFQKDLPSQGKALRRLLKIAGWCQAQADGFEADDVLATLARRHQEKGERVLIFTMDQDLLQCVSDLTQVASPKFGGGSDTLWDTALVHEKWGVLPERIPEMKALAGDSGDNIPGCPGCGKGWAQKLLSSANSLTEVLNRAALGVLSGTHQGKAWRTPALTKALVEHRSLILISWELARTVDDVEIEFTKPPPDPARLKVAFERLRFHSFLRPEAFKVLTEIA